MDSTITLTLGNFRCWENKTFTFPAQGICLIHGRSGKGKSTILNAIYFAISGKLKNITTFGKKSTKVTLQIGTEIEITRTRNPLSLKVLYQSATYEDDTAQKVIDEYFGTQFASTSYIDQDNTFAFANLSPSDKMELLEAIIMHEFRIENMRDSIKNKMTQTREHLASLDGQCSSLSSVLSMRKKCNVPDLFIEKNQVSASNVDKILEKVSANLTVCERNCKVSQSRIRKLEDQQSRLVRMQELEQKKRSIQDRLIELESEMTDLTGFSDENTLKSLQKRKEIATQMEQYYKCRTTLEDFESKIEHLEDEMKRKTDSIHEELTRLPSLSDLTKKIADFSQVVQWIDTLSEMDSTLENFDREAESLSLEQETQELGAHRSEMSQLEHDLELLSRKLECPECNTALQLVDKTLVRLKTETISTDELRQKYEFLRTQVSQRESKMKQREKKYRQLCDVQQRYNDLYEKAEQKLKDYNMELDGDEVDRVLQQLQVHKSRVDELMNMLKSLKQDRLLTTYRREREEWSTKCKALESIVDSDCSDTVQSVIEQLSVFSDKHSRFKTLRNKQSDMMRERSRLDEDANMAPDEVTGTYEENLHVLRTEREKFAEHEEKVQKYRMYSDQLNEWKRVWTEREEFEKLEFQLHDLRDKRDEGNERLRGLVKLRDHIKVAEQRCLDEFLHSLNAHASTYLEHFFEDDDLQIHLRSLKETKTGKEKISLNFEVLYRQMNGDLSYLSGGERDRVVLAYTLALSEMIHPNLLMLDECISSLDAETTVKVLETLRENYKGKLVLLISHQANLGFFDTVVEIS